MIKITMKDGEWFVYKEGEYTSYTYDKKFFIVIRGEQWIGLFKVEEVRTVIVE